MSENMAYTTTLTNKINNIDITILHIKKGLDRIVWTTTFEKFCPWLDMVETETSRANHLQNKVYTKLGITASDAACWVTNKHVSVKNVQIIPDNTINKIMKRIQLEPDFRTDVDAVPSNFMLLDPCLADAFDCLKISFSPVDMLHTEVLVLKIWDPSCRDDHIEVGTTTDMQSDIIQHGKVLVTIGDYEGFPLNIPFSWKVSRTALSYHNLCCYMYHKYKDNMSIDDSEPADFTSLEKGRDAIRQQLAEMFHSSIREDHHTRDEDSVSEQHYTDTVNEVNGDSVGVDRKTCRKCIVM